MFQNFKNDKERMFFRLRKNNKEDLQKKFLYTEDVKELEEVINVFLKGNKNFSIRSSNAIAEEVYGKAGKILNNGKEILELDENIYSVYKDKIELALNKYERDAINTWGITNETKLVVNIFNSSIEMKDISDPTDIMYDIKQINFNRTNNYDMQMLGFILERFLENKNEKAKIEHIGEKEFYLICGSGKLLFDFYAHDIVNEKVQEHNRKLNNDSGSIKM